MDRLVELEALFLGEVAGAESLIVDGVSKGSSPG
jgi:hypothetical protein